MSILKNTLKEAILQICQEELNLKDQEPQRISSCINRLTYFVQEAIEMRSKGQKTLEKKLKTRETPTLAPSSFSFRTKNIPLSEKEKQVLKNFKKLIFFFLTGLGSLQAQETDVRLEAQSGFLALTSHVFQSSTNNTRFDYVQTGGQDILFPYSRYEVWFQRPSGNQIRFLYNPLKIVTKFTPEEATTFDFETFEKGKPVEALYLFPFYRSTYSWSIWKNDQINLYTGLGLQIRNARIEFQTVDGEKLFSKRNVGPVPLLSFALSYQLKEFRQLVWQADGFWANIKFINGGKDSVEGAILDTSLSLYETITPSFKIFFVTRYLAGGSKGTSTKKTSSKDDGFTENWLNSLAVSFGIQLKPQNFFSSTSKNTLTTSRI
jgi:hypothetical protein